MLRHNNFSPEDDSWTRADIQEFVDSGRPVKDGKPDRKKKSSKDKSKVKEWLKGRGLKDDNELEKVVSDLDSYL